MANHLISTEPAAQNWIFNWVQDLPEPYNEGWPNPRPITRLYGTKRKRRHTLLSPPPSLKMNSPALVKRPRVDEVRDDDMSDSEDVPETTPKAPRIRRRHSTASSHRSSRSNASSTTTSSIRSGRSRLSHQQHLNSRTYSSDSMIIRQYVTDEVDAPPSLHAFWEQINSLGSGVGVIGQSQKVYPSQLSAYSFVKLTIVPIRRLSNLR